MYKDAIKGWMKHVDFMVIDTICLEIALLIVYALRQGLSQGMPVIYKNLMLAIAVINICVVFFCDSYSDILRRGYLVEIKRVLVHCGWVVMAVIVWFFAIQKSVLYSRLIILCMYPISVFLMIPARLFWKRLLRIRRQRKTELRRLMVMTTEENMEKTVKKLYQSYREYEIAAVTLCSAAGPVKENIYGIPVIVGKKSILGYIRQNVIDEVFIDLKENEAEKWMNFFVNMGIVAHINLEQFSPEIENKKIQLLGGCVVLSSCMKFAGVRMVFAKRCMDICCAAAGLVLAGIACLIFGPVIYMQSPGSIFFQQERVARNGRIFHIYKLRTMYPDAEERKKDLAQYNKMQGHMFKMEDDPRIIPIGHFLRKYSIDELPQFLNVLKGDMSLVGTRPPTVEEYKNYELQQRRRLAMKPGLTGMWQTSGRNDEIDFDRIVAMDAHYIENWDLTMDIKILWKTVKIVLMGTGM